MLPQHQWPGGRRQQQGALLPPALCKHAPGLSALEATTKRAARHQHEPGKNPAAAWKPSTISSPGWAPRCFAERMTSTGSPSPHLAQQPRGEASYPCNASAALLHVPEEPGRLAPANGAVNQCKHSELSQGTAGPSSLQSKHEHQPRHCTPSSASTTTDTLKKMLSLGYRSNPTAEGGGGLTRSLP